MISTLVIDDLLAWLGDLLANPVFTSVMIAIAIGLFAAAYYMLFTGRPRKTFQSPPLDTGVPLEIAVEVPWVKAALATDAAIAGSGPQPPLRRTRQLSAQESWSRAKWVAELAISKDPVQAALGKRLVKVMTQHGQLAESDRAFLNRVLELESFAPSERAEQKSVTD